MGTPHCLQVQLKKCAQVVDCTHVPGLLVRILHAGPGGNWLVDCSSSIRSVQVLGISWVCGATSKPNICVSGTFKIANPVDLGAVISLHAPGYWTITSKVKTVAGAVNRERGFGVSHES